MKKLLSLLSVLTISGTAAPNIIAASPYQKQEQNLENSEINYSQTNNLERLNRVKRDVNNQNKISGITKIVKNEKYTFIGYDNKEFVKSYVRVTPPLFVWENKICFMLEQDGGQYHIYDPKTKNTVRTKNSDKLHTYIDSLIPGTVRSMNDNPPILNNKKYIILNGKIYEKNLENNEQKLVLEDIYINTDGRATSGYKFYINGVILNEKIYFICDNGRLYEYEPLKLIESDIIDLQEQIRRHIYLYYQKQNPNSYVKNIEFNMNDLKYSDIELIEQEKNPSDIITNTIYQNDNETFSNTSTEDTIFKTIAHKYTEEIIESIQLIKGINKRIDNTIEEGTSETNTNSKVNTHSTTWSVGIKTELSAGWGPVTANISSSVTNEESNTLQIENSNSQTKNISKIISKSDSYDLSNIKEESKKTIHETEIQSQSFTVRPNQRIIVKTKVNKIIKKYKVTFKQKIAGKIKAKIKNEYDQITEQEFSIKDIILSLKENNLLPQEIILDNNNVFFKSTVLVGKTSFNSNTEPNWFDFD